MMNFTFKTRSGFSMIELVMVIVVLGILASMALPRLNRDLTEEAADSILSDIRYTQHLALMDNMHEHNDPKWQQKFWRIVFSTCDSGNKHYYMIGSDTNKGSANNAFFAQPEAAIDPANGKAMFGNNTLCTTDGGPAVSDRIFITKKYGINSVSFKRGCTGKGGKHLGFDNLGRPHYGFSQSTSPNYASYMTARCTMTFTLTNNDSFSINIEPETGYAFIVDQNSS